MGIKRLLGHGALFTAGLGAALLLAGSALAVTPIWASNTQQSSAHCTIQSGLSSGAELPRGQSIVSRNGLYQLIMQDDGNLVLYRTSTGAPLWATGTDGLAIRRAVMQTDGNFVLYDYAGAARWASNTWGNPGAFLHVQCDGNVVIYRP